MPSFTGKAFANFYKNILGINQPTNTGADATLREVQDGAGNNTAISLSDDVLSVKPVNDDTTGTLKVMNASGSVILSVNTTDSKVNVGASQITANTQYAYFGIDAQNFDMIGANIHYPIPFGLMSGGVDSQNDVGFGSGTDPATSFTASDAVENEAFQIAKMIWYVPDNLTIDAVHHIEGADDPTGDTTRMHLFSYDFTSGVSACLTNGAVVAHTTADIVNAGNEQPYLGAWTIDSSDVNAGKAILCFFRNDSNNADYTLNVTVKYHIR